MDHIDRKIIAYCQENGRAPLAEIGAASGLSVSAVNERLRKLLATGVIRGWRADVDPVAAGLDLLAFVFVLLDGTTADDAFRAAVTALPSVLECHHVTGEWSYLLKVRVRNTAALETTMATGIKPLPGVARTLTLIALSSPKETACLPVGSDP
jgi:Lrp/AsnC family leucine-responsive transcriptional regulator